jgi:hypothetical protein
MHNARLQRRRAFVRVRLPRTCAPAVRCKPLLGSTSDSSWSLHEQGCVVVRPQIVIAGWPTRFARVAACPHESAVCAKRVAVIIARPAGPAQGAEFVWKVNSTSKPIDDREKRARTATPDTDQAEVASKVRPGLRFATQRRSILPGLRMACEIWPDQLGHGRRTTRVNRILFESRAGQRGHSGYCERNDEVNHDLPSVCPTRGFSGGGRSPTSGYPARPRPPAAGSRSWAAW